MSIPRTSTRRPVAVAMLFLAVILLGGISYVRLPIDLLPDVSYPRLVVYTSYPDVAPAEVERLITERVEAEAAAVAGVERVTSVSREGVSLVTLRFAWGTDMDYAMLNVRERMDNLREALPETATRPRILRVDPESEPILTLSVAGPQDLWSTKELAETVFRRRLEQLDGVAQAAVSGGLDREIQVEVDPRLMDSYGLTIADVSTALAQSNVSGGSGTILQGRYRYPLRTMGEFQSVDEIDAVVVGQQTTGRAGDEEAGVRLIRVRDIGRVIDGFAERESMAYYDGVESVGLLVFKESGANTVTVAQAVDGVLEQLRSEFPEIELDVAYSQAGFIAESISNVVQALVFGGLLAFLVLFLFLRDSRYPFAIAAAIPISVVGTFALMEAAGVSLNIMSLGGLALGVGMLVDNSIVVLENVFRHREEGKSGLEAAALGAEEVQGAITASTLTTISVFGPIIYVEGVAGELFGDLSLAVAFSLMASLLVALTLLPALSARFAGGGESAGSPPPEERPRPSGFFGWLQWAAFAIVFGPFRVVGFVIRLARSLLSFWWESVGGVIGRTARPFLDAFDRAFDRFAERYHAVLEWSLDNRARVLGMAAGALVVTLVFGATLQRDLLPSVDQGAFDVRLHLEEGIGLETTATAAERIENALLEDPGVEAVFGQVGRDVRAYAEGQEETGLNTARFQVRLYDGVRTEDVLERMVPLQDEFGPGVLSFQAGQATALGTILGGSEADVSVRVRGDDLTLLSARAAEVRERLAALPMLGNVRVGTEEGTPQIDVEILSERAAQYGIEPSEVSATVDRALRGDRATEFVEFDRKIPVVVSYPRALRYERATLEGLRVRGVPIRELVDIRDATGPAEVRREEQGRMIPVYADVAQGGLGGAIEAIEQELSVYPISRELRMEVGGENEEMRRSFRDLSFAFALALILVYMILAAQFESFVHPFTILMAVPLALVGAVAALFATGQGFNTMSLIGVVILVGIVVNDAIVKVDFINQARTAGMALREAILEAGRVRLRPILMTTVTTVLGLLPMALGIGRGADLRAPLAIAVIGGLLVATLLTLIVVPVVYASVEDVRRRLVGEPRSSAAPDTLAVSGAEG
ncbi:MAG: efflux RND transporter permease subunit [Gemmatimonadetes bacterium]|nr:efflux RND transporter permease subunit [Gemmatimonadota bacterium]